MSALVNGSSVSFLLPVQIKRVIFCVFLETDFAIYKKKMSVMFQGMCIHSHHYTSPATPRLLPAESVDEPVD